MDYKEKYEQALEKARELMNKGYDVLMPEIFPELQESEGERIMVELTEFLKSASGGFLNSAIRCETFGEWLAWLEEQKDYIKLPNSAYTSNKDVIEFADTYSHDVWEKLMDNFKKIENYHIGCNDVSDIVLNAIINTYNWLEKQDAKKPTLPKWKYKKDNIPLLKDSLILNKYGCVAKSPSGAIVSDVWVLDYDELAKLPKEKLEKQGEKDPCTNCINDKGCVTCENGNMKETETAPKFKVGDWITNGCLTCKVLGVTGKSYELHLYNDDYCHFETDIQSVNKYYHLWSIQDAKDGDVLANDHHILILKELGYDWSCDGTPNSVKAYCGIKPNGNFELDKDNWSFCGTLHIHPAAKEQRDLLFSKMKEAGYEWDSKKRELKRIEPKKVNADKVIEWLKNTIREKAENYGVYKETRLILPYNSIEDFITDFKEDFGL